MSYSQLFWNNSDKKMQKSNINEKNKMLETEIERNMDINNIISENEICNSFPNNKHIDVNMSNFRESIEINLESRNNNRDIIEKRLNKREKLKNGWFNPYLLKNKYIDDLNDENNYLRPVNTYKENKKMDNRENDMYNRENKMDSKQ